MRRSLSNDFSFVFYSSIIICCLFFQWLCLLLLRFGLDSINILNRIKIKLIRFDRRLYFFCLSTETGVLFLLALIVYIVNWKVLLCFLVELILFVSKLPIIFSLFIDFSLYIVYLPLLGIDLLVYLHVVALSLNIHDLLLLFIIFLTHLPQSLIEESISLHLLLFLYKFLS